MNIFTRKEYETMNQIISSGSAVLGLEFGSTRIKSVLIGPDHIPLATGSHEWENDLKDGIWTYSEQAIREGLQSCYADLKRNVRSRYGVVLKQVAAIGVSAMMHGYLAFDGDMRLLVPFRTWRNTITEEASEKLTEAFSFNMPQRWSLSHLYQAILSNETHVPQIRFLTTLAGWAHYWLTGRKVLGVGDASGMMPIDPDTLDYDQTMMRTFDRLIADRNYPWHLRDILPEVLCAGEEAGCLTPEGARLLDPTGDLKHGCPVCPPEGDAGTGMVATNSVRPRTGNVSAGTSIFSMVVLEKKLSRIYPEIDLVTTPSGQPVGMVHCNSCSSDINAWVSLFGEFAEMMGIDVSSGELYEKLFKKAMEGDPTGGGMVSFNYFAGEPVTGVTVGRPLMVRQPNAQFNLANFMRVHLYASMETLKYGMEILNREKVAIDRIYGHGGLFKTEGVAQNILAAAIHAPVTVMKTAGEGGPWGMALLAEYSLKREESESLEDYLQNRVFDKMEQNTVSPDPIDEAGFDTYMRQFIACLPIEKAAARWKGAE